MSEDSQSQIQDAVEGAQDGSSGFKEVQGDGIAGFWERQEPFRPTFAAAYGAWAEVAMVAPLVKGAKEEIEAFIDGMRAGLGSVIAELGKAQEEGRQYYGVNLEDLRQHLNGVDLKLQGYPSLLADYVESQSRLQEALHGALPEANLNIRVGREQLGALRPLYFKHFTWVGKQMVFELSVRSLTEAQRLARDLGEVEASYQGMIVGQQAESLAEGLEEIKAIQALIEEIGKTREEIASKRREVDEARRELGESEGEWKAKETELRELFDRLSERLSDFRLHLADTAQMLDSFIHEALDQASGEGEGASPWDKMREGFEGYASKGNALVDAAQEAFEKRLQVLASAESKEAKTKVEGLEQSLQDLEGGLRQHVSRLEELCSFPGQARWTDGSETDQ